MQLSPEGVWFDKQDIAAAFFRFNTNSRPVLHFICLDATLIREQHHFPYKRKGRYIFSDSLSNFLVFLERFQIQATLAYADSEILFLQMNFTPLTYFHNIIMFLNVLVSVFSFGFSFSFSFGATCVHCSVL